MDRVILLKKHLKNFKFTPKKIKYVDGIATTVPQDEQIFKGAPFPVGEKVLKLFPEGALTVEDILLYTKVDLKGFPGEITREYDNKKYKLYMTTPYKEISDLKIYILKRVE